jgi:elongation factor G
MDRTGADFARTVGMIEDRLGMPALVLQLPWGSEQSFIGVIDLIDMKALHWADESGMGEEWETVEVPAELREAAARARHDLFEKLADHDPQLMEKYVHEEEPTPEELRRAIRRATLATEGTAVLCGSAFKNKAIQPLLDAIVAFLPSPLDVPPLTGEVPGGGEEVREPADDQPFSALAFKIMTDPYVGRLTYLRVYSGTLRTGAHVLNSTRDRKERVGRILQMHANHREDKEAAFTGDIMAVVGLKHTTTGDTLCDPAKPIVLESITFPTPVISVAVEPKTKADQDKLANSMAKLADEDPTFVVRHDDETGQTIISGMGELHLEVLVDRLVREFNVGANVGKPQVAYRETIKKPVHKVEGRYIKQTGGRGQYGHVYIDLEPTGPGGGYEFINKIVGGTIPREYIPAVDQGIQEALESGVLAGYPLVDVRATLVDGSYHDVDSSEMAFKIAGQIALREAARRADPVLLEPVMEFEVITPEEFMGDVMGDVTARRGRIERIDERSGMRAIRVVVPLAELFGYATELRSRTQGRASHTPMQLHAYQDVPQQLAREIIARVRGE